MRTADADRAEGVARRFRQTLSGILSDMNSTNKSIPWGDDCRKYTLVNSSAISQLYSCRRPDGVQVFVIRYKIGKLYFRTDECTSPLEAVANRSALKESIAAQHTAAEVTRHLQKRSSAEAGWAAHMPSPKRPGNSPAHSNGFNGNLDIHHITNGLQQSSMVSQAMIGRISIPSATCSPWATTPHASTWSPAGQPAGYYGPAAAAIRPCTSIPAHAQHSILQGVCPGPEIPGGGHNSPAPAHMMHRSSSNHFEPNSAQDYRGAALPGPPSSSDYGRSAKQSFTNSQCPSECWGASSSLQQPAVTINISCSPVLASRHGPVATLYQDSTPLGSLVPGFASSRLQGNIQHGDHDLAAQGLGAANTPPAGQRAQQPALMSGERQAVSEPTPVAPPFVFSLEQTDDLQEIEPGKVIGLHCISSSTGSAAYYMIVGYLGGGTFGEVWEAKQLMPLSAATAVASSGTTVIASAAVSSSSSSMGVLSATSVAVKVSNRYSQSKHRFMGPGACGHFRQQCAKTEKEFHLLDQVNSNPFGCYVVKGYEWGSIHYSDDQEVTYIMQEFADLGSLHDEVCIDDDCPNPLGSSQAKDIIGQVLLGLLGCHQQDVIHRDLKPSNILRCSAPDGTVVYKIADFGEGRYVCGMADTTRGVCGTQAYMAPEVDGDSSITNKVDVWAVGCTFAAIRTARTPFYFLWEQQPPNVTNVGVRRAYREELDKEDCPYRGHAGVPVAAGHVFEPFDAVELEFLKDCLEANASKRLSIRRLLCRYRDWLGLPDSISLD